MPSAKNRLRVEPATEAHAAQLAAHIRPEDAAEMMASHGLEPLAGLQMALRSSTTAKAILDGERVVAMFGTAPVGEEKGIASVWLLAANAVKSLPLAFFRVCRKELPRLAKAGVVLANMILATNLRALRLVEALGFEVLEPVPFGVSGLPFHPILLRRP